MIKTPRSRGAALVALLSGAMLMACGADPAPPAVAPKPPEPPAVEVAPEPEPEPEAAATAEPVAEVDAPPASTERPPSGRPPVLKMDSEEIMDTFGSTPAAKLELGDDSGRAVLRIPEYAFDRGVNVTFKIDKKGKSKGGLIGRIYRTSTQYAGSPDFKTMESQSTPFKLEMPAGNKKDANLAIGELVVDEKGREKIEWRIIAPTRIDDVSAIAYYELTSLSDAYLHVTTLKPTAPPAPKE